MNIHIFSDFIEFVGIVRFAIQNIFGTSWCPFITGLTMETYLNWPRRKKSGKTDNETFSLSHSGEILHVVFFGLDIKFDISTLCTIVLKLFSTALCDFMNSKNITFDNSSLSSVPRLCKTVHSNIKQTI